MWSAGDEVLIEYEDRSVSGWIVLASPNSISLMLGFEAMLGGHVGMMPVLCHDDGIYRSIVTEKPVKLSKL